ncbi:hypothetical protein V6N12_014792 [Hibiscus sabdariffa]|uniref:RNase H type-1 domain-containing protein n=1 Tax=Hibiscus sabdariffa TaxID=183260 RepID=A0ABR2DL90_9ROSI
MVSDMITGSGEWDWNRLESQLPASILESIAAVQPLKPHYGDDYPGWSKEMMGTFWTAPFNVWLLDNIKRNTSPEQLDFDWSMRFSIFCWLLWKDRCSAMFDKEYHVCEGILVRVDRLIIECNKVFSDSKVRHSRPGFRESFWKGPIRDWVKVNVDASVDTKDNRAVIELWAIYDGLRLAWEAGFRQVVVDYDNMEGVFIVNRGSPVLARSALVQSIWMLRQRDWLVKVDHVLRDENAATHELATLGRRDDKDRRVLVAPPGAVASIVEREQRCWLEE